MVILVMRSRVQLYAVRSVGVYVFFLMLSHSLCVFIQHRYAVSIAFSRAVYVDCDVVYQKHADISVYKS